MIFALATNGKLIYTGSWRYYPRLTAGLTWGQINYRTATESIC